MRALASALSIKRGKSDDGSSTASFNTSNGISTTNAAYSRPIVKSRSTTLFAKAPKTPLETQPSTLPLPNPSQSYSLSPRPVLTPASSSSSNESASLRTPEDDAQMNFLSTSPRVKPPHEEKKKWTHWFGLWKTLDKNATALQGNGHRHTKAGKGVKDRSLKHHNGHKLQQQELQLQHERTSRESASDTDDDSGSDSDSSESHPHPSSRHIQRTPSATTSASAPLVITHAILTAAQGNLRILIRNTLMAPSCSPPPLVVLPSTSPSSPSYSPYTTTSSPSSSSLSPYSSLPASTSRNAAPPRFPRSTSSHSTAPFVHTFESTLHLRKMLRRLERRNLTHAEARSIAVFGARDRPPSSSQPTTEKSGLGLSSSGTLDANANANASGSGSKRGGTGTVDDAEATAEAFRRVVPFSRGLRIWCSRPCFEERVVVWLPDDPGGEIACRKVMGVGRGLAVTDLEFSEGLEELAGLDLDDAAFERALLPPPPTPPSKGGPFKSGLQKPLPHEPANLSIPFTNAPSPLRLEYSGPAQPVLSPVSSMPVQSARKPSGSSASSDLREVRFTEDTRDNEDKSRDKDRVKGQKGFRVGISDGSRERDATDRSSSSAGDTEGKVERDRDKRDKGRDADDDVPLGYAIQAKKKREEKERFLAAEREKREKRDAEAQEEERKREEERRRRAFEEEERERERRRKAEEERKEKYAEEVAAARQRRELARAGMESFTSIRESKAKEREPNYSRPAYDSAPTSAPSRRRASEPPGGIEEVQAGSRASFYMGSSEDVRKSVAMHDGPSSMEDLHIRPSPASRRQSSISVSSQQGSLRRPVSEISNSSNNNANVDANKRMSLPRSHTAPVPQVVAVPYPVFLSTVPPVPPMPAWNMNMNMGMGLGMGNMGSMGSMNALNMPLLPPSAPFMMEQYGGGGGSGRGSRSGSPSRSGSRSHSHSRDSSPSGSRRSSGVHVTPNGSPSQSNASLPQMPPRSRQSFHAGDCDHSPRQASRLSRDITPDPETRRRSRLSGASVGKSPASQQQQQQQRQVSSSSSRSQNQSQARERKMSQGSSSRKPVPPEPKRRTTMM